MLGPDFYWNFHQERLVTVIFFGSCQLSVLTPQIFLEYSFTFYLGYKP